MSALPETAPPLFVACLCAGWCTTCDSYRATFDALAQEFGPAARFRWIDIEDEEDAMGEQDVDNFPTLLLASDDQLLFYGTVLPHAQAARQLVERALAQRLESQSAPALRALSGRLQALG